MNKEDIKQKEDRIGELYLAYYRLFVFLNDKRLELDKMRFDLANLAKEIEEDYIVLNKEKENKNGEKLC